MSTDTFKLNVMVKIFYVIVSYWSEEKNCLYISTQRSENSNKVRLNCVCNLIYNNCCYYIRYCSTVGPNIAHYYLKLRLNCFIELVVFFLSEKRQYQRNVTHWECHFRASHTHRHTCVGVAHACFTLFVFCTRRCYFNALLDKHNNHIFWQIFVFSVQE